MMRRTSNEVIHDASVLFGVPITAIEGRYRGDKKVCLARSAVIASLDSMGWSCSRIGRRLGRHHTTIMYSLGRLSK